MVKKHEPATLGGSLPERCSGTLLLAKAQSRPHSLTRTMKSLRLHIQAHYAVNCSAWSSGKRPPRVSDPEARGRGPAGSEVLNARIYTAIPSQIKSVAFCFSSITQTTRAARKLNQDRKLRNR